ncbi:hypothetical protein ACXET9_08575 [Brachybacterium sp. DNPG3]
MRPVGLGAAIAAADAACWHGLPLTEMVRPPELPADDGAGDWPELLLRALVFRVATLHLLGAWTAEVQDRHVPVAEAILAARDAG